MTTFTLAAVVSTVSPETKVPSYFEHVDLMAIMLSVGFVYVTWTIRKFLVKVDDAIRLLHNLTKIVTVITTEHNHNHPNSKLKLDRVLSELEEDNG